MEIIEFTKLKDGSFIVLRKNGNEFVTGMIPAYYTKGLPPTANTEHVWGHYFTTGGVRPASADTQAIILRNAEALARQDYIERIGRGF